MKDPLNVRVFAAPGGGGCFHACIADAEDTAVTLYIGTAKLRSVADAVYEGRRIARLRGWVPR